MKHAANHTSWAIGRPQRNGFHVRRVVWGLLMAQTERRADEEIRAASIMVETHWKRRHAKPNTTKPPEPPDGWMADGSWKP